jgi:hypothetical protein
MHDLRAQTVRRRAYRGRPGAHGLIAQQQAQLPGGCATCERKGHAQPVYSVLPTRQPRVVRLLRNSLALLCDRRQLLRPQDVRCQVALLGPAVRSRC